MWKQFFSQTPRRAASQEARASEFPLEGVYDPVAGKADILACFRLLLGRKPNPEEWPGHSSRAGEPLEAVVRTFVNSGEFKKRGLLKPETPEGVKSADTGAFRIWADASDPVIGAPSLAGCYETHVTKVISETLASGDVFVDVGANIGYFSMLASSLVGFTGRVYAVEPNDLNVKLLEQSRASNDFSQLTVLQIGASDRIETLFLHAASGNGNTAALDADQIFACRTVPGMPLDLVLADRPNPVKLIKLDVEGFEYKALSGMTSVLGADQPDLVIEFAPKSLQGTDGAGLLDWLAEKNYGFQVIAKDGATSNTMVRDEVLAAWETAGVDHIDIVARVTTRT